MFHEGYYSYFFPFQMHFIMYFLSKTRVPQKTSTNIVLNIKLQDNEQNLHSYCMQTVVREDFKEKVIPTTAFQGAGGNRQEKQLSL